MKAISLWQPWASLIANGAKKIETRSWPTNYRGPILIHAAKRQVKRELQELATLPWYRAALGVHRHQFLQTLNDLPYGALVAIADLVDCQPVEMIPSSQLDFMHSPEIPEPISISLWSERQLGNYDRGRFGWVLENVKPLETPFPYKGEQGLFEVPGSVLVQIELSNAMAKELMF